ncbi:MAG: hypothetical protein COS35_06585 [Zetaproteobacteria bacterium CG02_land_8_20_14_3_00_50_9]|nr:MAG: hypothetical protein AUJ57_00130 [Zetaproteobacteria bacterium CG1_02_53_45]PIV30504.1 MAG: hypothetical protein COS35_06585 [Zetaproteobacteria bacterium CG02_land_8_20_14_3_00_50_9]PIY56790.1 MAG: hypothetical protein COZ00_02375 [Zetaproteobacteria bacterium CG_4_10_14_0_8_um_filter_49_80]
MITAMIYIWWAIFAVLFLCSNGMAWFTLKMNTKSGDFLKEDKQIAIGFVVVLNLMTALAWFTIQALKTVA